MELLYLTNFCAYPHKLTILWCIELQIVMHNVKGICQVPKREFDKR